MDIFNIPVHKVTSNIDGQIFYFYGEPKTRKTSVAAKFPKPLILAFEIGYQYVDNVRAVPIQKWNDFTDVLRQLKQDRAKQMYRTIVIDTVSLAYRFCYNFVLSANNIQDPSELGFGKGWRAIRDEFEKRMNELTKMGYTVVFIAHATEKEDEKTGDVVAIKPDLDKKAAPLIEAFADLLLYVRKESDANCNPTVTAYSQLPNANSGSRLRYIDPSFEFTYENIEYQIKKSVEKQFGDGNNEEADETYNPRVLVEIDFDELKKQVISLGKELYDGPSSSVVEAYMSEHFSDIAIKDVTKVYQDRLLALKDFLLDLKSKN